MDIKITQKNDWIYVVVHGRLDGFTFELLAHRLRTIFQMGYKKMALNLGAVDYINIASIRLVVSIAKKLSLSGGQLKIVGQTNEATQLIEFFGKKFVKFEDCFHEEK
jgi:anti-anti-sigma factor